MGRRGERAHRSPSAAWAECVSETRVDMLYCSVWHF
jgi:hypothetical protein